MPPAIPDRWLNYKACGKVIKGTRIICFKVPLTKSVQKEQVKELWDIKTLLKSIPKLSGVIDLTNTNRYYNPEELIKKGILYKKILMPGRILPPQHKVIEFMDAVDEFLKKDDECLVGVHCTHGLNRTGYMVCRYMRDRLGIAAEDAIKDFQIARGYLIERENYIADILGKIPPAPDVGKETIVRPIYDKNNKRKVIHCNHDISNEVKENVIKDQSSNENDEIENLKPKVKRKRNDSSRSSYEYDFRHDY